jgi:hypothetical protein
MKSQSANSSSLTRSKWYKLQQNSVASRSSQSQALFLFSGRERYELSESSGRLVGCGTLLVQYLGAMMLQCCSVTIDFLRKSLFPYLLLSLSLPYTLLMLLISLPLSFAYIYMSIPIFQSFILAFIYCSLPLDLH